MIEIIFTRPMTIYNSSEPINSALFFKNEAFKPGFHIVVSVVSVVCRTKKKIHRTDNNNFMETSRTDAQYKRNDIYTLVVRDRMNSICPMSFFRTTDTTDTTDTTIWKPGLKLYLSHEFFSYD